MEAMSRRDLLHAGVGRSAVGHTHAGAGFLHEAFDKDDPARFTRPWFAWANRLFGQLILQIAATRPHLLRASLDAWGAV